MIQKYNGNVESCVHLNLLGVSCTFRLTVLKTNDANEGEEKVYLGSSSVQIIQGSMFYLYVEDAVTIQHCPRAALT